MGHRRVIAISGTLVMLATGCGGHERSSAAFCDTMESEQERILDQFNENKGGGAESLESVLMGLGASLQAMTELRTYFDKLAKVAPAEIQTEAEIVAEEYDELLDEAKDAVGDPASALVGTFMSSLQMSGPLDTMDEFAVDHCGTHI